MLARGKTPTDVVGCDGCCCYCDLYNLAEYAYRDRISYPPAGLQYHTRPPTPTPYSNMVGPGGPPIHTHVMESDHVEVEDEELKDELKSFQQHTLQSGVNPRMIPTDVAVAFLLSLDLLRNIPPQQQQGVPMRNTLESRDALYQALESYLLKHECHRRSSSNGSLGNKVDAGEGGFMGYKEGGAPTTEYQIPNYEMDGRGHIGEGGGGGGGGLCTEGGVADDKELGAYWELLDSELRPIEPVLSCPESLSIFSEHKEMAKKYLILQQEIFNLQHKKGVLEEKLSQAEKLEHLGNQRYQDKIRELENKRENLRRTRSKLRQQLEQICMRQEEQQQRQNHQEDVTGDGISHNHPLSPP